MKKFFVVTVLAIVTVLLVIVSPIITYDYKMNDCLSRKLKYVEDADAFTMEVVEAQCLKIVNGNS